MTGSPQHRPQHSWGSGLSLPYRLVPHSHPVPREVPRAGTLTLALGCWGPGAEWAALLQEPYRQPESIPAGRAGPSPRALRVQPHGPCGSSSVDSCGSSQAPVVSLTAGLSRCPSAPVTSPFQGESKAHVETSSCDQIASAEIMLASGWFPTSGCFFLSFFNVCLEKKNSFIEI